VLEKTQFYNRWLYDTVEETKATINIGFGAKSYKVGDQIVKVQLWDTAGQERYRAIARQYYRGSLGVILMYTIDEDQSFVNMHNWIDDLNQYVTDDCRLLLIGNKSDLEDQRQVPTLQALNLAREKGIAFLETSAINGNNCSKAIQLILQEIHTIQQSHIQTSIKKSVSPVTTPRIPGVGNTATIVIGDDKSKNPNNKSPPPPKKAGCCK